MKRIAWLMLLAVSPVSADEWRMLDESEFTFEAVWEETPLPGRFATFDVRLDTAGPGLDAAVLTVTVDLAGADMNDPDLNEAIAGEEWFSVEAHPTAIYTSEAIVETAPGAYRASGDLDLKGTRQAIEVPFEWSASSDRAEMKGELVIDRRLFSIGSGEWATDESIGFEVRLAFTVLLARQ